MTYRITGISNQSTCDCCGKVDLQLTIRMSEHDDTGREIREVCFGTHCAERASGMVRADGWVVRGKHIVKVARTAEWDRPGRLRLRAEQEAIAAKHAADLAAAKDRLRAITEAFNAKPLTLPCG